MRIPTYIQFKQQAETMSDQYENYNNTLMHANEEKKIIVSSEDPVLAQRVKATQDYLSFLSSYGNNVTMSVSRNSQAESAVNNCITDTRRITDLVKSAQNDTLNNGDRQKIATELTGLLRDLLSRGNTADTLGNYIFSGNNSNSVPFLLSGGNYQYVGSLDMSMIDVSPDVSVAYGDSGQTVFADIPTGNGTFTIQSGATPNTGTASTSYGGITSSANYVADTYTVSFVTNGAGQLAYQVVGATSGQVIPPPPATSPTDAPAYNVNGPNTINFNGLTFDMVGTPALTDQFVVAPSQKQNIFDTVNQLINLLNTPINNPTEMANFHQQLSQLDAETTAGTSHLTDYLSSIGYRAKQVTAASSTTKIEIDNQSQALSEFQSANMVELISDMVMQQNSLELTGQIYSNLQSLFISLLQIK